MYLARINILDATILRHCMDILFDAVFYLLHRSVLVSIATLIILYCV